MALHVLFPKSVTEKDSLPVTQKLFKSLLKSKQKQNLGKPLTYRAIYEVFNTVKKEL